MPANRKKPLQAPALEWIAAGTGLVFLTALVGVIGAEAIAGHSQEPPSISIRLGEVIRSGSTYIAPFEAVNASGGTAAALQVEGKVMEGNAEIETSLATIDYVAAHGRAKGGLIFSQDPAGRRIVVRPVGYQAP